MLAITDANPNYLHLVYDVLFISPLILNICVHFYFLFKSSYYSLKENVLKSKCYKRIKKFTRKKTQKECKTDETYKEDNSPKPTLITPREAQSSPVANDMTPSDYILKLEDYSVDH